MKTDPVAGKTSGQAADFEHNRLEMLNLLWLIKRGLERSGDRVIHLKQLRKDRSYLDAVLSEAAGAAADEIRLAADRVRELMAKGVSLDPEMDLETAVITVPNLPPVAPDKVSTPPAHRALSFGLLLLVMGLGVIIGVAVLQWNHFAGFGGAQPAAAPVAPVAPAKVVLRIHGSNTLGAEVLPTLAEAFLKKEGAKAVQRIQTAPNEWRIEASTARSIDPIAIEIKAHGSSTAFTGINEGVADIGASSRAIKKEEAQSLSRFGDMTSPAFEHVVGLDGLAVIVNKANTVPALTKDQIAKIFTGKISDWSEVGGIAGPIHIYARDEKSGTFDTFQYLVLGKDKISEKAMRFESSDQLSDKVAADTFGIGFIGLPYVRSAKAVAVADGESLPLLPTPFTVATEDYPLARRLYLYTPPNRQNDYIRDFTEFTLEDHGQQLVNASGFVSQTVVATKPPIRRSFPSKYVDLIQNAQRLSLSFRFRPEARDLDSKAKRDLDRVMSYLARNPGRQVILLGFTDSNGDPAQKLEISRARAQEVERELVVRGIFPTVVEGLGPALPVANNGNLQGAEKNRRVEIWIM